MKKKETIKNQQLSNTTADKEKETIEDELDMFAIPSKLRGNKFVAIKYDSLGNTKRVLYYLDSSKNVYRKLDIVKSYFSNDIRTFFNGNIIRVFPINSSNVIPCSDSFLNILPFLLDALIFCQLIKNISFFKSFFRFKSLGSNNPISLAPL